MLAWMTAATTMRTAGRLLGAVALASCVLVTLAGCGSGSDPESSASKPAATSPSASPTAIQVEGKSASELVGVPNTRSLDTVNTRPTQQLINEAEQGVSASKYPDPRDAYEQLINLRNMLDLSAEVDGATRNPDGLYQDTDKSLQRRTKILDQMYLKSTINDPNTDLTVEMDFGNVVAMDFDAIDVEIGKTTVKPTYRQDTKVTSVEASADGKSATVESQDGVVSNFQDPSLLGDEAFQKLLGFSPNQYYRATTEIRVDADGNWRIVRQKTNN